MAAIQREVYKRSLFGKIIKWLFIIFNILMLVWLISGMSSVGDQYNMAASDAERAGTAIGASIGMGIIIFFWVGGAIILGIATLLTRGTKYIITDEK